MIIFIFKMLKINLFIILITSISFTFSKKFPIINAEIKKSEIGEIKSIDINSYEEYVNYIKNKSYIITLFHVKWCGHCQKFKPILDQASSYNILNEKWTFLKIDCSSYSFICTIMNVQLYPTIKIYKNQKQIYKEPPRELEPLLQFLYKISDNPIITITSKKIFFEKYGKHSPIIEYKNNNNESEFLKCINNCANNEFLDEFYFGTYESEDNKEKINLSNIIYEWDGNCTNVSKFLKENKYPLLNEVNPYFIEDIFFDFKILIFIVTFLSNTIINNFVFSQMKNLSYNNRKYIFGYADYNDDSMITNFFNIKLNNSYEMKLIIYDFNRRKYYIHESIFNFKKQNENEIINEMKNLINNINKLKFTSGSKIGDFFSFINFEEMSPYEQIVVVGIFILVLLLIICCLFSFSKEDEQNDEEDEFEEFFDEIQKNENSSNKEKKKFQENKNENDISKKQKIE